MYTKSIAFEQYLPAYNQWVPAQFQTTDDAVWLHHQQLSLRTDVRKIVISSIQEQV